MRPVFIFGADAESRAFLSSLLASHSTCVEAPPFTASYLKDARGTLFGFGSQNAAFDDDAAFYLGDTTNASLPGPVMISRLVEAYASDHGRGDAALWLEHVAVENLPLLAATFPAARFLHLVRDGRMIATARWRHPSERRRPVPLARRWRRDVLRGLEAEGTLGDRCQRVSYEGLLSDLCSGLRALGDFVGVSPAGFRIAPSVLRKDYTRHLRLWRTHLTHDELRQFESVSGELLSDLGYPLEARPPQRPHGGRPGALLRRTLPGSSRSPAASPQRTVPPRDL